MNREERRRSARLQRGRQQAQAFAHAYRCPDCNADSRLVEEEHGVFTLQIFHDDTCPTYRAKRGGGTR